MDEITHEKQVPISSIYEGGDTSGRIADVGVAQELASVEADKGRNVALAMEGRREREAQTGLTDEQRRNVEIMDGLEAKYPDAFTKIVDEKGRKYLVASNYDVGESIPNPAESSWVGYSMVFSRDAVVAVSNERLRGAEEFLKNVNWTKFGDLIEKSLESNSRTWLDRGRGAKQADLYYEHFSVDKPTVVQTNRMPIGAFLLDLGPNSASGVKKILEQAQEVSKVKKERAIARAPKSAAEVLSFF